MRCAADIHYPAGADSGHPCGPWRNLDDGDSGTDVGTLTIGAWTARPKTGSADIDPYSRASIARSGELPVGTGDGIAFSAATDDRKRPLDGRCDVVVSGVTPPARFWTLTVYDKADGLWATRCNVTALPARIL